MGCAASINVSDCYVIHACVPGLNPADVARVFQRNSLIYSLSLRLRDHINGGLDDFRLKPVCIH